MLSTLLMRQLELELQATVQLASLAGAAKDESLREAYWNLAQTELSHYRSVVGISTELGLAGYTSLYQIEAELDAMKALILLRALEDTMTRNLEDALGELERSDRKIPREIVDILRKNLSDEKEHARELDRLFELTKQHPESLGEGKG